MQIKVNNYPNKQLMSKVINQIKEFQNTNTTIFDKIAVIKRVKAPSLTVVSQNNLGSGYDRTT